MDIGVYIQSLIHIIVLYALWTLFVSILAEYVVVLCLVCATTQLIDELDALFPQQLVFNALGVVYPPPILDAKGCEESFGEHLDMWKDFYWAEIDEGVDREEALHAFLNCWELDPKQGMFQDGYEE